MNRFHRSRSRNNLLGILTILLTLAVILFWNIWVAFHPDRFFIANDTEKISDQMYVPNLDHLILASPEFEKQKAEGEKADCKSTKNS